MFAVNTSRDVVIVNHGSPWIPPRKIPIALTTGIGGPDNHPVSPDRQNQLGDNNESYANLPGTPFGSIAETKFAETKNPSKSAKQEAVFRQE
jgi:hypothetical protein